MHVSRARFRPRIVRRDMILNRFPAERDLLFLCDGKARKEGTDTIGIDLARRGYYFVLRGSRDIVHHGDSCYAFATDDLTGVKIAGKFDFEEGEELDELSLQR